MNHRPSASRVLPILAIAALLMISLSMPACSPRTDSDRGMRDGSRAGGRGTSGASGGAGGREVQQVISDLDRSHIIGPTAARELDYRIDWQFTAREVPLKMIRVEGDSVFALDEQNYITRIKISDGNQLWQVQTADPVEQIIGMNFVGENLYLTTGSAMFVLDGNTGLQIGRHRLDKIANTQPVHYGNYLIYGSRNGQVVWYSHRTGFTSDAYQVAHSIGIAPVLHEGLLGVAGNNGTVMVLNASSASQLWSRRLLSPVAAAPAMGSNAFFVAGLDQHLRAYDIATGRVLWHVLTPSRLTASPVLVGERLYQQIPGEGLACYTAVPPGLRGGEHHWTTKEVTGSVIMQRRDSLFTWDSQAKRLTILDEQSGRVKSRIDLPQVHEIHIRGEDNDVIYAASRDGRVERLVPRN